jgi:outer membrane protein
MTNRGIKPLLFLFAALLLQTPAFTQTKSLSLDEAIEMSLANSSRLKLSETRILQAAAALREAKEKRLPDFTISGSYIRLNEPTVDLKVKLGGGSSSGEEGSTASSTPAVNQAAYLLANVSLPIFAGFRIQNGIESARYLEKAIKLDAEKDKDEVISNTIAAYSNLYKSKAALDLVKEHLRESKQRVADFFRLEENGLLARNDLLKAQLQQSNTELSLLDAENNWKLTSITMNLLTGLPEETELLPDSTSFAATGDDRTFTDWETLALENRSDAAALEYRRKAAEAGVKATKGEYYPSLAITGGYIAADIPNLLTITNAINAGVGVKYTPSTLWKNGAKVEQAKAQVRELQLNRDLMNDNIRLEVAHAYQNFLSARKKIEVYAKAEEQAAENYRIVKNKYDNSLATATDLLDADVAQLQAQLNQAFAKVDAVVAYKELLQTAGMLDQK